MRLKPYKIQQFFSDQPAAVVFERAPQPEYMLVSANVLDLVFIENNARNLARFHAQ